VWVEKSGIVIILQYAKSQHMEEVMYTKETIKMLLIRSDLACMRGVLAIFRSQTDYEKTCKATVNKNGLGFRANHAKAGSELALWMSCGHNDGVFRRAVGGFTTYNGEEVLRRNLCRKIAMQYLEQLMFQANRMEEI
jgi:hypothetical protein